jgi:hypothetical protein
MGHTTHHLQPLDVTIFRPLKTFNEQPVNEWLCSNPSQCVAQIQVYSLLSEVYSEATLTLNSANRFWATGLRPANRNAFLKMA